MSIPDILRTKLYITGLAGIVREHSAAYELRTPVVPNYFHGNCLVLKSPPSDLFQLRQLHRRCFGVETGHMLVAWGPEPAGNGLIEEAAGAGFVSDGSVAMVMASPPRSPQPRWIIRALNVEELEESFALADACDGSGSLGGDPGYLEFMRGMRVLHGSWIRAGLATWWGVFENERLIGQCGMVRCEPSIGAASAGAILGRFQAVEVHPEHQRRGVASALIHTVARDAFLRLGCLRVLLEADPTGPAIALYERLGFRRDGDVHSLLWSARPLIIRSATKADHAGIRSLIEAAFGQSQEAQLVGQVRAARGVQSLIAERNGRLLGHVMFSPLTLVGEALSQWSALALAPLAVVPDGQGKGVGTALVEAGLEACRAAGASACFVLGSPTYFGRHGFRPAEPLGFTCPWPTQAHAFQVAELHPGGLQGARGRVEYLTPFDHM